MVTNDKTHPLLSKKDEHEEKSAPNVYSTFSNAKISTPVFGHADWWTLNIFCLVTITFLSIWQVSSKAAMTINLESNPGEVYPFNSRYSTIQAFEFASCFRWSVYN